MVFYKFLQTSKLSSRTRYRLYVGESLLNMLCTNVSWVAEILTWVSKIRDFLCKNQHTVKLDFSGRQNKRQLDFKRQNENDRFFM